MGQQINGFMRTRNEFGSHYKTEFDWDAPTSAADDDAFVSAAVKQFEKELRNAIATYPREE
ncbi:hypothetical protein [Mycobacterium sp. 236(2023)]|uniref:hypothetical protein n=1 Tax=Mycobacterium sp. 236(2023) TaxID=3038163 RepID=UPI002414F441|nr:hypothetical protein [Mycobacterium sp. 236(2023)]MDG4665142.1 hypothetical protein [Mycobacterium sp. 236(2023)]